MDITYFDTENITDRTLTTGVKKLSKYRAEVREIVENCDYSRSESSLATWQDDTMIDQVLAVYEKFKNTKHVILIGIGGSSLGVEALHSVLYRPGDPELHVLDTISAYELEVLWEQLMKSRPRVGQLAVCVVSKSGGTTETLANASVLLEKLEKKYGKKVYRQCVFIGNEGSSLLKKGLSLGGHTLTMPEIIGGRYSVFTPVGLLPLLLLGHDVELILDGIENAMAEDNEETVAENAVQLFEYLKKGVRTVNFFAFDTRLVRMAKWYRQLTAESLGKARTVDDKPVKYGYIPTITTPVELHSIGQLYFSGFPGVYTEFVSFVDTKFDQRITAKGALKENLKSRDFSEVAGAMYEGVTGAYQETNLPYRATVMDDELPYELGLFMGMKMLETMYLAHLLNVNAFDQPNVELYKEKTRAALSKK